MRQVSASVLKGINETYKRTEEEKRRLELESQLYKRWRNSPRADSVLLSSKSNNEALAKMNWLDKQVSNDLINTKTIKALLLILKYVFSNFPPQIENQLERDKIEQQRDSDRLRLMEEFRKDDEILSSRKAERNEELTKLKTFQAQQMNELRTRENDSEHLHRTEAELTESNKQLRSELVNLDAHVNEHKERIQVSCDLRRIKMQLRNLSEAILRDLYYGNELLDRLTGHEATEEQQIQRVRNRFDEQIEGEIQIERQIECMYESEAKSFAMHQQAIWLKECETREQVLRGLINDQLQHNNNEIDFIGRRQHDLQEVRDCHRRAIDTTNDRIGALFGANTADENRCLQSAQSIRQSVTPHSNGSPNTNNLSADEIGLPDLFMESASIVGSPTRPQFGRKRVVWN